MHKHLLYVHNNYDKQTTIQLISVGWMPGMGRAWGSVSYICNAMIAPDEVHLGACDGLGDWKGIQN